MSATDTVFVFLHGFLGRAQTNVAGMTFEYFRGLRDVAAAAGERIVTPQMPGRAGIADRALIAKAVIDSTAAERIVLVGMSMGGLVARELAARHDPDGRVAMVATLTTPHRGSPIADRALKGESRIPDAIVDLFDAAVRDLSLVGADEFNAATPDRADVTYLSWACARPNSEMPPWFKSRQTYIEEREGPNDGLVSVASATWGHLVNVERADHFEAIGWSLMPPEPAVQRPFEQRTLWAEIMRTCRDKL